MGNACLVRCFKRFAKFFAEVHCEIGEVFDHDRIVFVCHFADDLQFVVCQAEPGRVVGIGVDHSCDITFGKMFFQDCAQFFSTVFVYIE